MENEGKENNHKRVVDERSDDKAERISRGQIINDPLIDEDILSRFK